MHLLNKRKGFLVFIAVLGIIYLLSRLISIMSIPIFTDEAIYMRWAQIAKNDANWRFISLTDGKQPLYIWFSMLFMEFIKDPLLAGRLVSVVAGFGTTIALFLLAREIFKNRWIGFLTAVCYVVWPFSLVYDRMALYDSLVGTFAVLGLYLTILLVRKLRLDVALVMGFVTGAAVLNKTNGFFTIYLLPFALILFEWRKTLLTRRLTRFVLLSGVVIIITYLFYMILRLSPFFYIIEQKNALFVYPFKEWISHPFLQLWSNLGLLTGWFISYMGIPFIVLVLVSFVISKKYMREKVLLFLWFVLPFIALIVFGKQLYPRYILFMTLSLLPLIGYSLYELIEKRKNSYYRLGILSISLLYSIISSGVLLVSPVNAPIPQADKGQYISDWPSGYGIKESIRYFKEQAKDNHIEIATEGTFGLLPYAYEMYLVDNPNVTIRGYWPIGPTIPEELTKLAKLKKVYVTFYQNCSSCPAKGIAPSSWPLRQIAQYKKAEPNTYLTVYQVIPQ